MTSVSIVSEVKAKLCFKKVRILGEHGHGHWHSNTGGIS